MRRFKFHKLVRDKIVGSIISVGNTPDWRVLTTPEYIEELKKKILEEAEEIPRTHDKEDVVKELADVEEIIDNLLKALQVSRKEFAEIKKAKNAERGSFKKRHYVEDVTTSDEVTRWVQYYLDNADKYPEIRE